MNSRRATNSALSVAVLGLLAMAARGAELKTSTLADWSLYVDNQNRKAEERADGSHCFLWVDENPDRFREIQSGITIVEPIGENNPLHISSGLIHHWIGTVFIPRASVEDVLAVTRDYAHYPQYYKPGVAYAKPIRTSPFQDEFTIRIVNDSVLSRISLLGTYVSRIVPVSPKRWYITSETSSMQEIKNFGSPNQREFIPGRGSGYIWRLYSSARMEERDGGVIVELEAIALSRDIPASFRFIADPIVRRLSRDSLNKSLSETVSAVRQHVRECAEENVADSTAHQIIESGTCALHAGNSGLRDQEFAGHTRR